ncbi:Acr-6 [Aphelenchoides fujianensis]|nr:Acr-6 [Aphelenchoides fujianensis]
MDSGVKVILIAVANGSREGNRLFEDLLRDYDRLLRPVRRPQDAVKIAFKFKLLQILDLHEKGQVLRTSGLLRHVWTDYRLSWDPQQYGNMTRIHIPGERIWLPDIILYNNADGRPTPSTITKAEVHSNGSIEYMPPAHYDSLCVIDTEWFPYDMQSCELKFGSWTYSGSELDMIHPEPPDLVENITLPDGSSELKVDLGIDISEYQESVEFDLLSIAIDITYDVTIRRRKYVLLPFVLLAMRAFWLFYTMNLMIPCIGIATLASFVFYLPSESHNKITLSVSVLVSLTVFFLLLIEIIPPTSTATPLIARYLLFTMFMVTLSVVLTVGILNIHHQGLRPMSPRMRWLVVDCLGHLLFVYKQPSQLKKRKNRMPALNALRVLDDHFANRKASSERQLQCATISYPPLKPQGRPSARLSRAEREFTRRVRHTIENICYIQRDLQRQNEEEDIRSDYRFMALIVDRLLLVAFSFVILAGTFAATLSAPSLHARDYPITLYFPALVDYET